MQHSSSAANSHPPRVRDKHPDPVFRPRVDAATSSTVATGYGSRSLHTAADCARALRFGNRELAPRGLLRVLAQLPVLVAYLCRVPRVQVRLSDSPAGRAIAEHLSLRRWGLPRFRLAQGVLYMPEDFAAYLRGRSRQALRTTYIGRPSEGSSAAARR